MDQRFGSPIQTLVRITGRQEIADGIHVLTFASESIASRARPGQFVNVLAPDGYGPFLRRPFSISRVEGTSLELMFNVVGQGTRFLSTRRAGDELDVLGPLGQPFRWQGPFSTAWLVGGGLGVAPLPFLTEYLLRDGKAVVTFLGARTGAQIVTRELRNLQAATDDGSQGFHGTVVDLLASYAGRNAAEGVRIFGCGPTPMLKALQAFAVSRELPCEISLEGDMACGIGLCQGCPVERTGDGKKYSLVCTEGPAFECREVLLR